MLYEIFLIFICLFAALGIVDIAVYFFNKICIKRLPPHSLYILIDDFEKSDAERIVRFTAEHFLRQSDGLSVKGIIIGENADLDEELRALLRTLYKDYIT